MSQLCRLLYTVKALVTNRFLYLQPKPYVRCLWQLDLCIYLIIVYVYIFVQCRLIVTQQQSVLLSLVTALTVTRLDYGCATLTGIPRHLTDRLQSVLNAAA